jgi:hypothetical protein
MGFPSLMNRPIAKLEPTLGNTATWLWTLGGGTYPRVFIKVTAQLPSDGLTSDRRLQMQSLLNKKAGLRWQPWSSAVPLSPAGQLVGTGLLQESQEGQEKAETDVPVPMETSLLERAEASVEIATARGQPTLEAETGKFSSCLPRASRAEKSLVPSSNGDLLTATVYVVLGSCHFSVPPVAI